MLEEILDEFKWTRPHKLEVYCFDSEMCAPNPRVFVDDYSEKINLEFWRRLKHEVGFEDEGKQGKTLSYEYLKPVDLTFVDLSLPFAKERSFDASGFPTEWVSRKLSNSESLILSLFEAVKDSWDPQTNPRLSYLAQCMGWNHRSIGFMHVFNEIFASNKQQADSFWRLQHETLLTMYFDLASSLIEKMRPQLIMIDKWGHDKHGFNDMIRLDLLLAAEAFYEPNSATYPGNNSKAQFHKFLRELEQKYPDLPMGEDLYERPMEEGGKDFLDAIHFYDPYKSQAYGSFSLWQLLRKVVYHERYRSIPHERLWSYALDLGIHAARLVAIDATKPLGEQMQTAIREGTYDREHYLYRSFYIYLHGDYLIAVLPDDIAYWGFGVGYTPDLREQPLSWRPDSLAGYDYSQMELLYTPPPAEPEGPGWYLRRTGFERVKPKGA